MIAKYLNIINSDRINIGRDPMLIMSVLAPFMILAVALFLFPIADEASIRLFNFPLNPYFNFGYAFLLPVTPMLFGMVFGFILLDERDGGIISYYSVTPLAKNGYVFTKMTAPVLLSFAFSFLYLSLTGLGSEYGLLNSIVLSAIIASEAPMMLLFLGAFAANKVEGIAISKGFGILLFALIIDFFFVGWWRYLLAISPLWWVGRSLLSENNQVLYLIGAALTHSLFIIVLFRKFNKKID